MLIHYLGQQQYYAPPPTSSPPAQTAQAQYYPPPPQQTPPQATAYPPPPQQSSPQQSATYAPPPHAAQPPNFSHRTSYQQPAVASPPPAPAGPPEYHSPPSGAGGYPQEKQEMFDTNDQSALDHGAAPAAHFVGASATQDDVGTFNGGSFRISHRDSNTILTIQLAHGCPLTAKPGKSSSSRIQSI